MSMLVGYAESACSQDASWLTAHLSVSISFQANMSTSGCLIKEVMLPSSIVMLFSSRC